MSVTPETMVADRPRARGWRELFLALQHRSLRSHAKILNGSIVLLIGSVFVSLANFGYNIGVARLLGPSDFSHAAAAVTILMLVSAHHSVVSVGLRQAGRQGQYRRSIRLLSSSI